MKKKDVDDILRLVIGYELMDGEYNSRFNMASTRLPARSTESSDSRL